MDSSPTPQRDPSADQPGVTSTPEASGGRKPPESEASGGRQPPERGEDSGGLRPPLAKDDGPAEVPLTPLAWLAQNGIYLLIIAAVVIWIVRSQGWEGLPSAALTVLGVGFIIFIHELGHFLVAKWCDVHVLTFSIGFGPALPGCSFKRGETTYKLSLLPLGGYVNMVGEGTDADENEDYPRSFKNKTVGQRMAIISAGVIMNVLLGIVCFIFVFMAHGIDRTAAVVERVEPGSPAWEEGVRPGWKVEQIGSKVNPFFEDLRQFVTLSGPDENLEFTFREWLRKGSTVESRDVEKQLHPRREGGALSPTIGVTAAQRLELVPERDKKLLGSPVRRDSAAAAARALDLSPGDVVLATTDPDNTDRMKPLQIEPLRERWDWVEFARRLRRLAGQPMKIEVERQSKGKETVELPADGFHYGDRIVGTTDPAALGKSGGTAYDPFKVRDLPPDPRSLDQSARDPFVFRDRMRALAGKPVIVQVRRGDTTVNLFVPPAFHRNTGARMHMGKVAAVRKDSPAAAVGLVPGDMLSAVVMTDAAGRLLFAIGEAPLGAEVHRLFPLLSALDRPIDPVRLPWQLAEAAQRSLGKKRVTLTVVRKNTVNHTPEPTALKPMEWDATWDDAVEPPMSAAAPLAISQLGLAYWIESRIVHVAKDSPAARARREGDGNDRLRPGDVVAEIRWRERTRNSDEADWSRTAKLKSKRGKEEFFDEWAHVHYAFQFMDYDEITLKVRRDGELIDDWFTLTLAEDGDWPLVSRGIRLMSDQHLHKAENLGQALSYGVSETWRFITSIYLGLSRVVTGRVSSETFGGPVEIVSTSFNLAGEDIYKFILFLGILSINLAVVNFLPIPLLDGGHMVFLIYEKLRGKPASENVRAIAAYIGLTLLLALMVYVFYLDGKRRGWW